MGRDSSNLVVKLYETLPSRIKAGSVHQIAASNEMRCTYFAEATETRQSYALCQLLGHAAIVLSRDRSEFGLRLEIGDN